MKDMDNLPEGCKGLYSTEIPSISDYAGCVDALLETGDKDYAKEMAAEACQVYKGVNFPRGTDEQKELSLLKCFMIPERVGNFINSYQNTLGEVEHNGQIYGKLPKSEIEDVLCLYNLGDSVTEDNPGKHKHLAQYAFDKLNKHREKVEHAGCIVDVLQENSVNQRPTYR